MTNETKCDVPVTEPEAGSAMVSAQDASSNPLPAPVADLLRHPQSRSLTITPEDICIIVTMNGFVVNATVRPKLDSDPPQHLLIVEYDPMHGYPEPTSIN